jgi:hypothetical protein
MWNCKMFKKNDFVLRKNRDFKSRLIICCQEWTYSMFLTKIHPV